MDLATVDHLLTTTRSVRRRLDLTRPVDPEVIERCLEIAMQAPIGGNLPWPHFVVVTDQGKRAGLAALYRRVFLEEYAPTISAERRVRDARNFAAWAYLAEHLHEVPVHVIACVEGRVDGKAPSMAASRYGSILPAVWSFMLALRARGVGAAWTTLHIRYEQEAARLFGIPANVTQVALLPVAYYRGNDFKPALRIPAHTRTYWNRWGTPRRVDAGPSG
jgi:nitroreductase